VQSFDTGLRRSLGRRSPRQVVLARILEARAAGFDNVCVDLLYGLPGQTADLWHADLEAARTCGATGVSAYPLVSFPASRLGRQLSEEKRGAFIDLATEYALFMAADRAFVEKQGWARFTPVQYGDAHAGIATYVASCGRGAEVLALGAAAGGNLGRLVYLNAPGVADYVRGWAEPARWPLTAARSSDAQELARPLWRLGETTRLVRAPGEHAFVDEIIGTLVALGLATSEADGVSLTPAGCFWAGNVNELFSLAARDEARRS
jgi:oxygen-independent coproporphyrinogen-3 oxidase